MTVRCVLFDLFGTLVHYDAGRSSQGYPQTHQFLLSLGASLDYEALLAQTEQIFAELDAWSHQSQQEFSMLQMAERLFLQEVPSEHQTHANYVQFADIYTREWSMPVQPVHGVQALLSRASRRFEVGLITNTHYEPMVESVLERCELDGFKVITTSVSHGRPKPHPDIFLDTLALLDCKPEEAVYVGDSYQPDYLGATGVGMQCFLLGRHARVPREQQIPTVIDLPLHLIR